MLRWLHDNESKNGKLKIVTIFVFLIIIQMIIKSIAINQKNSPLILMKRLHDETILALQNAQRTFAK